MIPKRHDIDESLEEMGRTATPVVRLTNLLLRECLKAGASKCRLEYQDDKRGVAKMTIGGVSTTVMAFPIPVHAAVIDQLAAWSGAGLQSERVTLPLGWNGETHEVRVTFRAAQDGRREADLEF